MRLTVNGERARRHSPPLTSLLTCAARGARHHEPEGRLPAGRLRRRARCSSTASRGGHASCRSRQSTVRTITTRRGPRRGGRPLAGAGRVRRALRRAVRLLHVRASIMAATALIERDADGRTARRCSRRSSGHVCRCTGYVKIVDAVDGRRARASVHPEQVEPSFEPGRPAVLDPREPGMKAVGARLPRYDGVAHVTGRTQYVDDVRVRGTLWTKALRSPHHHAAITRLDTSKAGGAAGRARDRHHEDVPHNVYGHLEALGDPRPTSRCSPTDEVRYKGQPIAAVAADRRGHRAARRSTRSRSSTRSAPALFDIRKAMDPDCADRSTSGATVYPHFGPYNHRRVRKGDIDAAFEQAGHDRRGRLPPAGDRALPDRAADRARRPGGERPPDDLLVHAGDVLLDGRRRRAPRVAAEQAEVRRRDRRRRLRRQGRHGDARRSARCSRSRPKRPVKWRWTREEEFLVLLDPRAVAHGDRATPSRSDGWILGRQDD